jgi:hypothetical protein
MSERILGATQPRLRLINLIYNLARYEQIVRLKLRPRNDV